MARKTIAEMSDDRLNLQAYLKEIKNGTILTWQEIENNSGVKMDMAGKQKVRLSLKAIKKEYSSIHGEGVQLANDNLVVPLLSNKFIKIDRAVKRADKTHHNLQEQFFHQLSPVDQKKVLFAGAIFGAIRNSAREGKLIYRRKGNGGDTQVIPLPKLDIS